MEDKIIDFETFYDPNEAEIIKSKFLSFGIQCYLSGGSNDSMNLPYGISTNIITLRIFEKDKALAEKIRKEDNAPNPASGGE